MQRTILEKLQHIESNLANQSNQSDVKDDQEQSGESVHSQADANEFFQLPEYAFQMQNISHQEQQQHMGEYPEEVQLYSFSRMQTEEELNDFEKRLSDSEYFKEAYNWLNSLITETNCENRMLAALDLLFDKMFVNKCSWTGRGRGNTRKAPIRCRRNLLQMFKVIGSTRKAIVSRADVEIFFIKKLKQSKQRLNMQGTVAMSQKQMLHFIRLVEERDVLWNRSHPEYEDMVKQGDA
uniref:DUF4806 domain-containing protein n=1 Tax=Anopheles minimus TaxID=112268 RepID=A0A182WA94_9DIPT